MHRVYDLLMMIFGIALYSRVWWMLPIMAGWTVVGLSVVYGPGRHHGLLHVLRVRPETEQEEPELVSLQSFDRVHREN